MWVPPEPLSGLQPLDFYILKWRQEDEAQELRFSCYSWGAGEMSQHAVPATQASPGPDPVPRGAGLKALSPWPRARGRLAMAGWPWQLRCL